MARLPALVHGAVLSLRPGPSPFAVAAAARAFGSAAVIAVVGVLVGDVQAVAVAYLGAACTVAFIVGGPYRNRAMSVAAQALGAAVGIGVGASTPQHAAALIATAAVAGAVSGAAGSIGPNAPAFGMMLSIGVAFGQFGGSTLAWWQQAAWYLVGSAVVALATLAPWVFRRGVVEHRAAAEVMTAAADLCESGSRADRVRLAAASAVLRRAGPAARAELVAFAAATMYADGETVPTDAVAAIRTAAAQVAAGDPVAVSYAAPDSPGLRALADALSREPARPPASSPRRFKAAVREALTPTAAANAVRIGVCMGVATALTVALHEPEHAFWLALTVAVIVRPEYASVFVRTMNRVCGTVAGAALTALLLALQPPPLVLAVAAAVALGFAVLSAPKLYGLSVIGITASALLAASLTETDVFLPELRLLDTVLGATVAVVFGYVLWPGARRLPGVAHLDAAVAAAGAYLDEAVKAPELRTRWQARRDDAYRLAHQARAAAQAALVEPPPVSGFAIRVIPAATELEDIVDEITAVGAARDVGRVDETRVADVRRRLAAVVTHP